MTSALDCFFAAAHTRSIRAAAEQLHIAPSAVSRHIAKLETALGTVLFERLPRGLRLNSAGEVFFYHARESSRQIDRARALISDMQGLKSGLVRIATTESVATAFLPPIVAEFWKQYPEIAIALHTTRSGAAFAGVAEGEFDLAIGFDMPPEVPLRILASAKLVIGAWLPKDHKLAAMDSIRFSDLPESRLLMPDQSINLRSLLNLQLRRLGDIEPRLVSNSTSVLRLFSALGCGVSVFTKIDSAQMTTRSNTVFRPIREFSRHFQTLQLCSRGAELAPAGLALANHLSGPIKALSDH